MFKVLNSSVFNTLMKEKIPKIMVNSFETPFVEE